MIKYIEFIYKKYTRLGYFILSHMKSISLFSTLEDQALNNYAKVRMLVRFTNEVNETQRSRYAVGKDRYKVPNYHIAQHAELNQAIVLAGTCQNDCLRAGITA